MIYTVVKSAFASAEHADDNEQDLVEALRMSKSYIQELSLVAEVDGKIVAHIMFTRASIGENAVLALVVQNTGLYRIINAKEGRHYVISFYDIGR